MKKTIALFAILTFLASVPSAFSQEEKDKDTLFAKEKKTRKTK